MHKSMVNLFLKNNNQVIKYTTCVMIGLLVFSCKYHPTKDPRNMVYLSDQEWSMVYWRTHSLIDSLNILSTSDTLPSFLYDCYLDKRDSLNYEYVIYSYRINFISTRLETIRRITNVATLQRIMNDSTLHKICFTEKSPNPVDNYSNAKLASLRLYHLRTGHDTLFLLFGDHFRLMNKVIYDK